jgi:predicted MPP superfamily phosphohydrolase
MPVASQKLQHPALRPLLTRRRFLLASALSTFGVALYSNEIARHEIQTTHRTFRIRRLPPAFDGFRLVQISDIHLEDFTEEFFLRDVIRRVNALAPDLVLITGDFCSRGPLPERYSLPAARRCAELLPALTCPQRFGILGNHDAVVGPREIRGYLENEGTPMLVNQFVPIERGGQRFFLAGLDDCISGHPNLTLATPTARQTEDAPVLLMAHEPDYIRNIVAHERGAIVDYVLSGHTHGGQVCLPGGHPLLLPPGGQHYPEGHYLVGNLQLHVNRGIGTVGVPYRFNCPPEITVATLRPAEA